MVKLGIDRVETYIDRIKNKRVGMIVNCASYTSKGIPSIEFLRQNGVKTLKVFAPEHGYWMKYVGGEKYKSYYDEKLKIQIVSLYGKKYVPEIEDLQDIDLVIYDINDVGLRFYTYISSLIYFMRFLSDRGIDIPLLVFDRPNPLSNRIEGIIAEEEFQSFVCACKIPVRYGLTVGELAKFIQVKENLRVDLEVIEMEDYESSKWYDELGIAWHDPSTGIRDLETALIYTGCCLLEGTNLSEGRGTDTPFKVIGAPWLEGKVLNEVKNENLQIDIVEFIPKFSKYKGEKCQGLKFRILNRERFKPFRFFLNLLYKIYNLYPEKFEFLEKHFDNLCGTDKVRKAILEGKGLEQILRKEEEEIRGFRESVDKSIVRIYKG